MNKHPFDTRVRAAEGEAVIELTGDIDAAAADGLLAAHAATAGLHDLTLDFTDVAYINSSGIALIVGLLAKAKLIGQRVSAFGLSDHYRHIFEITRLSDYLTITVSAPAGAASPSSA